MDPIAEDGSLHNVAHPSSKAGQSTAQLQATTGRGSGGALGPTFTLVGSSVPSNTANQLLHALCSRSWDVALTRLRKRPHDALNVIKLEVYGTERRILPLHLAVAAGAPAEVIRALLEADEDGDAVRDGTRNKIRDDSKHHGGGGRRKGRGGSLIGGGAANAELPAKTEAQKGGGGEGQSISGGKVPCAASQLGLGTAKSRPPHTNAPPASAAMTQGSSTSSKSLSSVMSASSAATAPASNVTPALHQSLDPTAAADSDGWTALHLACLYRSPPEVFELLLDAELGFAGAAKVKSGYGLLPLHVVAAGLQCDRMRWSEDAYDDDGDVARGAPNTPESERSIDAGWRSGDLARTTALLLRTFPGAIHVPCSRPLGGNGWTRDGSAVEPTAGGGADVQLTPVQYAKRYLPDIEDTREVLDLLEGRTRLDDVASLTSAAGTTPRDSILDSSVSASESFNSAGTSSTGGSRGSKDNNSKRGKKKKKKKHSGGRVQSLRTSDVRGKSKRKSSSSQSRSILRSVAAAMRLIPSEKAADEALTGSTRGGDVKPAKLYSLILSHDWSGARERLVHHPEEAAVWTLVDTSDRDVSGDSSDNNGGGKAAAGPMVAPMIKKGSYKSGGDEMGEAEYACHRLPLHRACASKPPAELVKGLVEAYPDGVRSREKFAMLPLHVACQHGASTSVIETLVDLYPASTRERDAFGLLPLHLACTEGCSPDVLVSLLRSYPGAVEERDDTGRRPADYVRESLQPNRDALLRELGRDSNYWFAPTAAKARGDSGERRRSSAGSADAVPELYFAVVRKRWEEALELVESDPAGAGVWVIDSSSSDGTTSGTSARPRLPLHAACRRRAPPEVVRALLAAHPAGASATGGKLDLLPLHMACQFGGDPDSVEELVRAYPEGTSTSDAFGLLPIHLAVTEGASPAIVQIMLHRHPPGAQAKDRSGKNPLDYAKASFHPHKEEVLELLGRDPEYWSSLPPPSATTDASTPTTPSDTSNKTGAAIESMTLTRLIERRDWNSICGRASQRSGEAAAPRDVGDGEGGLLPLHRACAAGSSGGSAPRHAIESLLKAYPTGAKTVSEKGDLPLHIACKQRASLDVVQVLMEAYPLGASTRDDRGRLPVHLACISGTTISILEALLRASPGTSEMTDGAGRTPLMYAEESFHRNKVELIDALQREKDQSAAGEAGGARTTRLYDLVAARRWVEVVARAREAPSEAFSWSIDGTANAGRLPIHLACSLDPPRRAVASLINAHVDGVRAVSGSDDTTCLHAACASGATVDVIQLLINAHPDAVATRDRTGLLPIHAACSASATIDVIKLLLRASPEPVSEEDEASIAAASERHPDRESILAELPPAPPVLRNDLRGRLVPMRSVPARLGSDEEKKKRGAKGGGSPSPRRGKTLEEAVPQVMHTVQFQTTGVEVHHGLDQRGTSVMMLTPADQNQSTRSLGRKDDEDESNAAKSTMVQIPVISV